jgi:hypothetical protein
MFSRDSAFGPMRPCAQAYRIMFDRSRPAPIKYRKDDRTCVQQLFADRAHTAKFGLVREQAYESGVVHLAYRPAE